MNYDYKIATIGLTVIMMYGGHDFHVNNSTNITVKSLLCDLLLSTDSMNMFTKIFSLRFVMHMVVSYPL